MGTITGRVALAPFAHDWVGGDIDGLAGLANTLYAYCPQVSGVAATLSAQVGQVVGAAGWQGTAASAFAAAWERDSRTAAALEVATGQVAKTIAWLATTLSQIEAGLEQGADDASAHGVPIGANGAPGYAPPGGAAQTTVQQWLAAYQTFYQQCMQAAQTARDEAAGMLLTMDRQIVDGPSSSLADTGGDVNTVGDLLYDLLAGDNGPDMEAVIKAIQKAWYGSGAHTAISHPDSGPESDPDPDSGPFDFGPLKVIDGLSAAIGALLNTYEDVHDYHKPLLQALVMESQAAWVGLKFPEIVRALTNAEEIEGTPLSGEAGAGEAGAAEAGETAAEGVAEGVDPLALVGIAVGDYIHNAYIESGQVPADVREYGPVMGPAVAIENVQVNTDKDLENTVTGIGGAVEQGWHDAEKDPERALPDPLP
jgi:uncharacterized protein YukE